MSGKSQNNLGISLWLFILKPLSTFSISAATVIFESEAFKIWILEIIPLQFLLMVSIDSLLPGSALENAKTSF